MDLAHQNSLSTTNNTSLNKKKIGYSVLPNDIFSLKLSSNAKIILIYLYSLRRAPKINPTLDTIAEQTGMSWAKVNKYSKELVSKGLIAKNQGHNAPNCYFILWKSQCDFLPQKKPPQLKLVAKDAEIEKERVQKSIPTGSKNRYQYGSQNRHPINNSIINKNSSRGPSTPITKETHSEEFTKSPTTISKENMEQIAREQKARKEAFLKLTPEEQKEELRQNIARERKRYGLPPSEAFSQPKDRPEKKPEAPTFDGSFLQKLMDGKIRSKEEVEAEEKRGAC